MSLAPPPVARTGADRGTGSGVGASAVGALQVGGAAGAVVGGAGALSVAGGCAWEGTAGVAAVVAVPVTTLLALADALALSRATM